MQENGFKSNKLTQSVGGVTNSVSTDNPSESTASVTQSTN